MPRGGVEADSTGTLIQRRPGSILGGLGLNVNPLEGDDGSYALRSATICTVDGAFFTSILFFIPVAQISSNSASGCVVK
jgi:hypothetical protein